MFEFEQLEKEASERVITISQKDFIDKAAKVCADEATKFPIVAILAVPMVGKLMKALFDDEKANAEEVKKD